ncbi:hypothetical protein B5X24_HaOG211777 [Helicoverpa armigera]|uniref:Uncharacterized protein n=1 Tax=Helicoverpa armigera TaxID=29058 RepID=A0A2W1BG64_HELAM|nr:hypothetical protein B5X24_HaOG211777 [Helicoverpa armigera]
MITLLLHLFLIFEIITGNETAKFDEAELIAQRHQQALVVNKYMDDFEQSMKDRETSDHDKTRPLGLLEPTLKDEQFLDYDNTHIWWSSEVGDNPETTFLPTPIGHHIIPTRYTRPTDYIEPKEPHSTFSVSTTPHFPSFITKPTLPQEFPMSTRYPDSYFDLPSTTSVVDHHYPQHPVFTSTTGFTHPTSEVSTTMAPMPPFFPHPSAHHPIDFKHSSRATDYHYFDFSMTPTPLHPEYPDKLDTMSVLTITRHVETKYVPLPTYHLPVETSKEEWTTPLDVPGPLYEDPVPEIVKEWENRGTKKRPGFDVEVRKASAGPPKLTVRTFAIPTYLLPMGTTAQEKPPPPKGAPPKHGHDALPDIVNRWLQKRTQRNAVVSPLNWEGGHNHHDFLEAVHQFPVRKVSAGMVTENPKLWLWTRRTFSEEVPIGYALFGRSLMRHFFFPAKNS